MRLPAINLATLLIKDSDKIELAREVLRVAIGWKNSGDWSKPFQEWKNWIYKKMKVKPTDLAYKDFFYCIEKCFQSCQTVDDFKKMCGLVPEKYAKLCYEKRYREIKPHNLGCGCMVIIEGINIIYQPEKVIEDDVNGDRDDRCVTVDLAAWDGYISDFIEIKVSPNLFQTKNINYFRLLRSELENKKLKHLIRLYSWGNKELLIQRLATLNVSEHEFFLFIGKDLLSLPSVTDLRVSC